MKCMSAPLRFFIAAVIVAALSNSTSSLCAQDATDQLENAANTGTLFDGSDGSRFGTDTEIDTSGSVPDVSPPTAVETSTDTATAQDTSDDSESGDSSQANDSESDTDGKSGTEKAE